MSVTDEYYELEFPVEEGTTYEDAVTGDTVTVEHERTPEKVPLDGVPMWLVLTYDREVELVDEWDDEHSAEPFTVRLMNGKLHEDRPITYKGVPLAGLMDYQFFENRVTDDGYVLGAAYPNPGDYLGDLDYVLDWNEYHVAYEAYGNTCIQPTTTFLLRRACIDPEEFFATFGWLG